MRFGRLDLIAQVQRVLAGHLLSAVPVLGVIQAADALERSPTPGTRLPPRPGWARGRAADHASSPDGATRRAMRATAPCRSAGCPNGSPTSGRHSLTGTTPGASNGNPPNSAVTWA